MGSLDFVKDYKEIIDSQGIQYFFCVFRKGKDKKNVDFFVNITDEESLKEISFLVMNQLKDTKVNKKRELNKQKDIDKPKKKQ